MISLILKSVGRLFLGPVMKTVDRYFQGRTDRHRIDGDVTINRDSIRGETTIAQVTADASVDIAAIEASAAIAGKQPMLITITQAVIYSVAALYYLALVVVSIIPDSHAWTVRSLPTFGNWSPWRSSLLRRVPRFCSCSGNDWGYKEKIHEDQ